MPCYGTQNRIVSAPRIGDMDSSILYDNLTLSLCHGSAILLSQEVCH